MTGLYLLKHTLQISVGRISPLRLNSKMAYFTRWKTAKLYVDKAFFANRKVLSFYLILNKSKKEVSLSLCWLRVEKTAVCNWLCQSFFSQGLHFDFFSISAQKPLKPQVSRIFHRRACQNICSLLVPCHLMARGLRNGNNSFEDDPKAFKQTFQFIIFYFVFSFIASPFPFIQMVMFKDCGCQKHQQCPLPSAALLCLCWI